MGQGASACICLSIEEMCELFLAFGASGCSSTVSLFYPYAACGWNSRPSVVSFLSISPSVTSFISCWFCWSNGYVSSFSAASEMRSTWFYGPFLRSKSLDICFCISKGFSLTIATFLFAYSLWLINDPHLFSSSKNCRSCSSPSSSLRVFEQFGETKVSRNVVSFRWLFCWSPARRRRCRLSRRLPPLLLWLRSSLDFLTFWKDVVIGGSIGLVSYMMMAAGILL